jgi:predicted transposase/invertase (TIGR01784 family)
MKRKLLSPLADPIFKRIFGEEKDIMMSLINAAIELKDPVVEIEYLQPELVGEHMYEKTTIVDVRCKDARNRHFIVEMQISLHKDFLKRVLFNACKVYSRQLPSGSAFEDLQPVHCLCILNNSIDTELPHYVQTYNLAKVGDPNSQMEGIHFHFIELSKFMKNGTFDLKNPLQAWMKFFAEPEYFSTMPIKHYETFEELKKAIEMLDESNFTEGQLYAYDKYMDNIRTQKSIEAYQRETGLAEGRIAGRVEGRTEGKSEGVQLTLSIINELRNGQLAINQIAEKFQVTEEVVAKISDVISNSTLL